MRGAGSRVDEGRDERRSEALWLQPPTATATDAADRDHVLFRPNGSSINAVPRVGTRPLSNPTNVVAAVSNTKKEIKHIVSIFIICSYNVV